jgi:4-amino-4-deoxy-L-arabinose transferase-like glycosyltransferase
MTGGPTSVPASESGNASVFQRLICRHPAAIAVLLFALATLPILNSPATYMGDERFYTDSVIRMIQTGDYLTPVNPDGTLRFNKPILTYWGVALSYKIFGISLFSSRLPSLLAGCGLLWLTFRIARVLFPERDVAAWATWILLSNVQLLYASTRSTPDAYLALFLALSIWGFARILLAGDRTAGAYFCAYVGAGLAIEAKGFLGLLPIALAGILAATDRTGACRLRHLLHPGAMLVGAGIALGWYVAVFIRHGYAMIDGFLYDQVTSNLPAAHKHIPGNILAYTIGMVRPLLPWSLIVIGGLLFFTRRVRRSLDGKKRVILFIAVWYAMLLLVFTPANFHRTRFFLTAFMLASGLIALVIDHLMADERARRHIFIFGRVVAFLAALAGAGLLAVATRLGWETAMFGLTLIAAGILGWRSTRPTTAPMLVPSMALIVFILIAGTHSAVLPAISPTPLPELVRRIQVFSAPSILMIDDANDFAGPLNVAMGGAVAIQRELTAPTTLDPRLTPYVFFPQSLLDKIDWSAYRVEPCGFAYPRMNMRHFKPLLLAPVNDPTLKNLRQTFYLASPAARPPTPE